jgi:hypothetical protein
MILQVSCISWVMAMIVLMTAENTIPFFISGNGVAKKKLPMEKP